MDDNMDEYVDVNAFIELMGCLPDRTASMYRIGSDSIRIWAHRG